MRSKSSKFGWLGVAKVSGILHHRGVQLILASSWARPAILGTVKAEGGGGGGGGGDVFISFVSLLSFLFLFLPCCPSLSFPLLPLLSLFSLSLGDDTNDPQVLNRNTFNLV